MWPRARLGWNGLNHHRQAPTEKPDFLCVTGRPHLSVLCGRYNLTQKSFNENKTMTYSHPTAKLLAAFTKAYESSQTNLEASNTLADHKLYGPATSLAVLALAVTIR